jgi:hypothetical protein
MKKHLVILLVITCLGTISWAQGTKPDLFDTTKSTQELEIMKGILGTTLSFVSQNLQKQAASTVGARTVSTPFGAYSTSSYWGRSIEAFYLFGQGAVFVVPASSLRLTRGQGYGLETVNEYLVQAQLEQTEAARELAARAREAAREGVRASGATSGGQQTVTPPPQAAQAPKTPPPAPLKDEELRKKVAEAQEKVKRSREDAEANRAKYQAALAQIKGYLLEALANYGDSLTTVKPNEYISVVFMTGASDMADVMDESSPRSRQQIVTVQRSWITDYKAGRLTLDAFRQKALQYNE